MKFLEKIAFIENKLHLNDYAFCTRFRIKISVLKKWKRGQLEPTIDDIKWICNYFNLNANRDGAKADTFIQNNQEREIAQNK